MSRRYFGEFEEDAPPEMTFVEGRRIRTWTLQQQAVEEVMVLTSHHGGVSRLLERVTEDVGGGNVHGRASEFLVAVIDLAHRRPLPSTLICVRNDILRCADVAIGLNGLQRYFLAFDLAVLALWSRRYRLTPVDPELYRTDLVRLFDTCSKLGLAVAFHGLLALLRPAALLKDSPLGEMMGERLAEISMRLAHRMLAAAADGMLLDELRKPEPDVGILTKALPELLAAGLNAMLVERTTKRPRLARSGKPLRLLLVVDAADGAHDIGPPTLRLLDPVTEIVSRLERPEDCRVILGARREIPDLARSLGRPIELIDLAPFERGNVINRLNGDHRSAPHRDRMVAALCPERTDRVGARAFHTVWIRREALPPPRIGRHLTHLARHFGEGLFPGAALLKRAEQAWGASRARDLLTELERNSYVWIWNEGESQWRVNSQAPSKGGH